MAPGKVLVVDDDPVVLQLLRLNFEMEGWQVVAAADGEEAIRRALEDHPDAVVLDVMMPGMTGLEAAGRLRGDPATASLPILLLSAKAQHADVAAGLAVADEYVTKPFEPLELLERVATLAARTGESAPR